MGVMVSSEQKSRIFLADFPVGTIVSGVISSSAIKPAYDGLTFDRCPQLPISLHLKVLHT